MTANGAGRVYRPSFQVLTACRVTLFIAIVAADCILAFANLEDFSSQGRSTANLDTEETVREGGVSCDEARVRRIETFHIDTSSVYPPDLSELHVRENVKVRFLRLLQTFFINFEDAPDLFYFHMSTAATRAPNIPRIGHF